MKLLDTLLRRRRLIIATTVLLAVTGVASWFTMPREEDPQFPQRNGLIIAAFPGADAETVERLVADPLEEHLAEVEEVWLTDSISRAGVVVIHVEMHETVYDTDSAWDEVEDVIAKARREFPAGVLEPELDQDLVSQDAVVYAITGSADPLVLAEAAELVKRRMVSIAGIQRIDLQADPGEQITIEYDDAVARRLGLDPSQLGLQLAARSNIVPGGVLHLGEKTAPLRPATEFRSLDEIRRTPIILPSGASVPLSEVARVRRGPVEPAAERMRWNGEPSVGVAIVPQDGLDRVVLGKAVRERAALVAAEIAPLQMEEMIFQPDKVEERLEELTGSLKLGILIVALVLLFAMGLRLGVVVSLVVPLVAFAAIAFFAAGGGILHQISIAALVIALGMLVDNAIVVAENIQYRIDEGEKIHHAAVESVKELALPLGTATGTTLAAFVPMLISKGNTADFTRSIPILIMLTLGVSYLFAILVTPVLSELLLRPAKKNHDEGRIADLGRWVGRVAVERSGWVLVGTMLLLGATVFASRWVDKKFFPAADRMTVVVEMELPEGTHVEATDEAARKLEQALLVHPEVDTVATFVGRNGPRFFYNLLGKPNSPHRSMIVAETHSYPAVDEVIAFSRDFVHRKIPEATVIARKLEQGPPVDAPVEVRVMGYDLEQMEQVADEILGDLRAIPGAQDVHHTLGLGVPQVSFEIDDAAAARQGLSRVDVARSLLGRTLGTQVGQFRGGEDPVPILVRSAEGESLPPSDLMTLDVAGRGGPVPLAQVAQAQVEWRPAAIERQDRTRIVRVRAQVADGTTAAEVFGQLRPTLDAMELPDGVYLEYGGEIEESGKANAAILRQMPLGLLLLLFFLLLEFNSFRRVAIVMMTVPLAAVGVVPGLILSGNPFGFMSLLGMISLVGIVVNNAIVLLDVIETKRDAGASVQEALEEAVKRRTRPILLTMATTVAGLSPLAFSEAALWPPLAWAMISGLMASTVLTLVVIPALYRVLFDRPSLGDMGLGGRRAAAAVAAVVLTFAGFFFADQAGAEAQDTSDTRARLAAYDSILPPSADAEPMTLEESMLRAATRPAAVAAARRAIAAEQRAVAAHRAAWWPTIGMAADATRRDRDYDFDTPLGSFVLGERTSTSVALRVEQPLFDPARALYGTDAARAAAESERANAERTRQALATEAAERFVTVLEIDAAVATTESFARALEARLGEMEARVDAGRVLEADALKIRLDLESAELDLLRLADRRRVATADLGRLVGADGPVEPDYDIEQEVDRPGAETIAGGFGDAVAAATAARPDVAAVEAALRALELQARTVRAERLPRLVAQATYLTSDGDPFQPEELATGTLAVSWVPFASGTRAPRAAAYEAEADALRADLAELRRGVEIQLRDALARLHTARTALMVRERGVDLAEETLRVERERHGAGRATTNDLLSAEANLRRQRTDKELARLEVVRAWIAWDLASGALRFDGANAETATDPS